MDAISNGARALSTANGGHARPRSDKNVPRKFGLVAKLLWRKPAAVIASIEGCDERTGKRILAGQSEVTARLLLAACEEMLKPIS